MTINSTPHPVTSDARYDGGAVTFTPTYCPVSRDYQDRSLLLLGAADALYYPSGTGTSTIKAFRAYFQLNNGLQMAADGGSEEAWGGGDVKAFVLDIEEGGADRLDEVRSAQRDASHSKNSVESIFNLSGRRVADSALDVQRSNLPHGVYIVNGKKIIVK